MEFNKLLMYLFTTLIVFTVIFIYADVYVMIATVFVNIRAYSVVLYVTIIIGLILVSLTGWLIASDLD